MYKFHKNITEKLALRKTCNLRKCNIHRSHLVTPLIFDRIKGELTRPNLPRFQH